MATTGSDSRERGTLHGRAKRVRRRELDAALARLDAHGGLTDAQRAILAEVAAGLVADLLAGPRAAIDRAEREGCEERARRVRDLLLPRDAREGNR
ncbi:MAG: hypothetical protein ABEJ81_04850 [Haloferacaceae archaeon]